MTLHLTATDCIQTASRMQYSTASRALVGADAVAVSPGVAVESEGGCSGRNRPAPNTDSTLAIMSESSTGKAGQELVTRGERGRLQPGTASLNPLGRKPRGQSIAELVRRETDWSKLRARLEGIVHSAKAKDSDAIQAALVLLDRGFGKAPQSHQLEVTRGDDAEEHDFSHLSLDQLRAALAERDEWTAKYALPVARSEQTEG